MQQSDTKPHYSEDKKRNNIYITFVQSCAQQKMKLQDIIQLGYRLMRHGKLHPHFFGNNSLLETARYLSFFALQLPQEYDNPRYTQAALSKNDAENIIVLFEKRIAERLPVAYITNETYYMGKKFCVNKNVLVPRSVMSTRFQDFLQEIQWKNYRVLDLCTGSGCIGITLALLHPNIRVDLADISPEALSMALVNITQHSVQDRVECIQSDLFENIQEKYDLIITNPPYVSTSEYNASPTEFKNEPKLALEAGKDGLDIVHKILANAQAYLNPEGTLIAEVGITAAKRLKKQYPHIPFKWFTYRRPNGRKSIFDMDCVFRCEAQGLSSHYHRPPRMSFFR